MQSSASSLCIVIIGMGRSGTSAMSGALRIAGVALGNALIGASGTNTRGHFENAAVVQLNNAILKSLKSYNGDFLPVGGIEGKTLPLYAAQARAVLRDQFSGAAVFGIKDPRMCRVWPIWEQALAGCGAEARFIVPLRHPLEAAQSLYSYGVSTNQGLLWWLAYTLDGERYSRSAARVIVSYPDLVASPRQTMEAIAAGLGVAWPKTLDEVEGILNEFLDGSMRHRSQDAPKTRAEADARLIELAEAVYEEMSRGADRARMDRAGAEFANLAGACRGWRPQLV